MTTQPIVEGTWSISAYPEARQVYVPGAIFDRYVGVAMASAVPRMLEGAWYADLAQFPGVWAQGASPKGCLDTLEEVLSEWVIAKIVDADRDIPVIDEIDLNHLS